MALKDIVEASLKLNVAKMRVDELLESRRKMLAELATVNALLEAAQADLALKLQALRDAVAATP